MRELQSIAGTLCYAVKVVPQGTFFFLHRIYKALKSTKAREVQASTRQAEHRRPSITARLGAAQHRDFQWWARMLSKLAGTRKMVDKS